MKKSLLFLLIVVFMVSCSLPDSLTALLNKIKPQSPQGIVSSDLLTLIENDQIRLIRAQGYTGVSTLSGRLIEMELYNNTEASLEVLIPCGTIFIPGNEAYSRMMVVQSHKILFEAAEVKTIKPFVLSIDNLRALPVPEQTYTLDMLTDGKQLQFAECLCNIDLSAETETKDLVSLQLAAWMLDENSVITTLPEDFNELLKNITGLPIAIPGLENALQDLAGTVAPEAQGWLDRCGIKP